MNGIPTVLRFEIGYKMWMQITAVKSRSIADAAAYAKKRGYLDPFLGGRP